MGVRPTAGSLPDFKALFEAAPGCFMVLAPDPPRFTILAATDDYLRATKTRREEIVGRGVFDVFPDNPDDSSGAEANSRASFERVIERSVPDRQALQQHDIRRPVEDGGGFETRFWSPLNSPVLGEDGEVRYIIHRVEDVTELVCARQQAADAGAAWASDAARAEALARLEVSLIRREADGARERESRYSQAEQALRRFELLARHSRDIFLFMRRDDGRILEANEAAIKAYGYTREELLELTVHDLRAPETRTQAPEQMAMAGAQGILFETRHQRKDGSTFPVEVSSQGASIAGTPTLISVIRDISQREQAEEALRLSEEKFARVFHSSPTATCLTRIADSRIVDANAAFSEVSGYSREEFDGRTILELELWPKPEDREAAIEELRRRGFFRNRRQTMRTRWGETREFLASAETLNIGGEPTMLSTWIDITERKQAEEALRQSELFYRQTLESIPGMVFTTRPDGFCDYQSQQWVEYTGVPMSEHLGDGWNQLLHPDDRARAFAVWREALKGSAPYDLEYRVRRHDGAYEWFKVIGRPISDAAGKVVKWFGLAINVENLKRAEAALSDADRRKDEFIAVLSHELRNPLAPIRYALPLLQRDRLDEAGDRAVAVIDRQVAHLTRLVDDLLDVSRITGGKIDLRREHVTLAAVLSSAVEAASPAIATARHTLRMAVSDEPIWLHGDPARLAQVVTNILNNSAKYTPRGGEITLEGREDDGHAVIRVRDTGMGIPEDALSTVFEMFRQVNRPDRAQGGLGIGLALARQLVEMHGGTIAASSDGPGQGAEFVVRLPAARDPEGGAVSLAGGATKRAGRRLKVLVVDDNADLVDMLATVVERAGHDVRKALDGRSAVSAALSYRPDVVLLDIGLPVIGGLEVARELRRRPETAHARLVALTGWGQAEDRRQTAAAGFDRHMTKPTDPKALERLLVELAASAGPGTAGA